MLIDLHAHTSAISHCCLINAEEAIKLARECGFGGLAIANHYTNAYFTDETYDEWIERYISEWQNCEKLGKEYGVKIFKAVEVTMEHEPRLHMLIYGADEAFLRSNPLLCQKSLPQLYEICKNNDCSLVQAHPFRNGATIQNTDFLDGIEINCHPLYKNSFAGEILKIAKEKGIAITVGCDYHADTYRSLGGSILPDSIITDRDLANYIISSKQFELQVHEPSNDEIYKITYIR